MKILVIDDDPSISRLARLSLAAPHVEVLTASDAEAGCALAASDRPDAILLDYHLGGIDGSAVLGKLRDQAVTAAIPVVFLSATQADEADHFARDNAAGWIAKPFDHRALAAQLATFLGRPVQSPAKNDDLCVSRERYARDVREKLPAIHRRLALIEKEGSRSSLEEAVLDFHRLAGSGGTFGFPSVSELAGGAEAICRRLLAADSEPSPPAIQRLRTIAAAIGRELAVPNAEMTASAPLAVVSAGRPLSAELERVLLCEGLDVRIEDGRETRRGSSAHPDIIVAGEGVDPRAQAESILKMKMSRGSDDVCVLFVGTPPDPALVDFVFETPLSLELFLPSLRQRVEARRARSTRILIVESAGSDPFLRTVLESAGYEVCCHPDPTNIRAALSIFGPDVLLLGPAVEYATKAAIAADVRKTAGDSILPIVALDAAEGPRPASAAGVPLFDDHFRGTVAPSDLLTVIAARAERQRIVRRFMENDPLTDLLTRSRFLQRLREYDLEEGVTLFLSLPQLTALNDREGRQAGDLALLALATVIRKRLRGGDIACRWDGATLGLRLRKAAADDARSLAASIAAQCAELLERTTGLRDVPVAIRVD